MVFRWCKIDSVLHFELQFHPDMFVVFVFLVLTQVTAKDDLNTALFSKVGRTAVQTGYCHLIFDLKLDDILVVYNEVLDLVDSADAGSGNARNSWKAPVLAGLDREKQKFQLLWDVIFTDREAEFARDIDNVIEQALEDLGSSSGGVSNGGSLPTQQGRRRRQVNRRRRRRQAAAATTAGVAGLAAFGLGWYTNKQLTKITRAADMGTAVNVVATQAGENAVRISELYKLITTFSKTFVELAKQTTDMTAKQARIVLETYWKQGSMVFQGELRDYVDGLYALMDHRLLPAIVNPDQLQGSYDALMTKARKAGLQPLSTHPGIIFQSPVTAVRDGDKLLAIVHVPMYSDGLMNLYRYLPAPFFLDSEIALRVNSATDFIALNDMGTLAKVFTSLDLQQCTVLEDIYHCPRENVLRKDLENICLYNLFHQKADLIESTCDVFLDTVANHAIQINGNDFRVFAAEPTPITFTCKGDTKHDVVDKVYLLKLNQTCPRANTATHLFVRNTQVSTRGQIVHLPTVPSNVQWLSKVKEDLATINVDDVIDNLQLASPGPVSLTRFREHVWDRPVATTLTIVDYIQYALTALAVVLIIYFSCRFCFHRLQARCPSLPFPTVVFRAVPSAPNGAAVLQPTAKPTAPPLTADVELQPLALAPPGGVQTKDL